jgi:hypothetical protein
MSPIPPPPKPIKESSDREDPSARREVPREKKSASGSKKPPMSPGEDTPRRLTPTEQKLRDDISRFYMMVGTIIRPFGRWIPFLQPIGDNVKIFSQDAADAWIDLAKKDPRIKEKLEQWTSASAWGSVIGIHFAIAMGSMPEKAAQTMEAMMNPGEDPLDFARKMGATDQDIEQILKMVGQDIGGPGDTIQSNRSPVEAQPIQDEPRSKAAGIVSPSQLGVTRDGQENSVPIPAPSGPIMGG